MKFLKATIVYLYSIKFVLLVTIFLSLFQINAQSQCAYNIQINQTSNDCNNPNIAQLQAVISGPGSFENFTWLNSDLDTVSSTVTASNLFDGVYVFITEDTISNCISYATAILKDSSSHFLVLENPVSCLGCEDGFAEVIVNDTTSANTYLWDDAFVQTTAMASDLEEGVYAAQIQIINCNLTAIANINDCGENIKANFSFTSPTCSTCNDGSILASVTGGTPNYNYQWDDDLNQTTLLASNLRKNKNYSFTVTDSLNCQKTFLLDSVNFCKNTIFSNIDYIGPTCDTCSDASITVNYSGLYSPLTHIWTINGSNALTLNGINSGNYQVVITDTIGCKLIETKSLDYCTDDVLAFSDSIFITNVYNFLSNTAINQNDSIYNLTSAETYLITENTEFGNLSLSKNGSVSYKPYKAYSGIDKFSYTVFTDCGFSDTVPVYLDLMNDDMVWPGDANNDGFVDNFDLLPIGAYYDSIGPQRTNTSTNYQGFFANDFPLSQFSGANLKHADCNGLGKIDSFDIAVIDLNYSLNHSKVIESFSGNIPLTIEAPANVNAGDTVEFKIKLGSASVPANNTYGLAYTFNIDPKIIDQSYFEVKFNDSWFTPNNDRISISKAFLNKGKIDITQSRFSGNNANGNGDICSIIVVIEEDLGEEMHRVELNRVRLVDNLEIEVLTKRTTEEFIVNAIEQFPEEDLDVFSLSPNPVIETLQIEFREKDDYRLELFNVIGEKVFETNIDNESKSILQNNYDNGIYFLTVTQDNKSTTQKIVFSK